MRRRGLLIAILICMLGALPAAARDQAGLPLPRYVSLRASRINLRSGPGMNFPVQWVYQRKHMPVEVVAEYDTWRKIRDWQGTTGWVHQSMLDGSRYALITGEERLLRSQPDAGAPPAVRVGPGVVAELLKCDGAWCRLAVQGYRGWLRRDEFFGVYATEKVE